MENINNLNNKTHKITMTNRRMCLLTGVKDVLAFDIHEVLLETELGMLTMKGEDLHISRLSLDQGEVDVDGRIDSLVYSETNSYGQKGESLFARLFR
jgi:sporulation protein YabP